MSGKYLTEIRIPNDFDGFLFSSNFVRESKAPNTDSLQAILKALSELGFLSVRNSGDVIAKFSVRASGFSEVKNNNSSLNNCVFIARRFLPWIQEAIQGYLIPELEKHGFQVLELSSEIGNISDKIIASIRKSSLVICDLSSDYLPFSNFTSQSPSPELTKSVQGEDGIQIPCAGAYFEAGFAKGLGKPVLYTCNAKQFDFAHFDIRQDQRIRWEDGPELADGVISAIQASDLLKS